jgi:sugar/nucleoside kinase (ribokinase family)
MSVTVVGSVALDTVETPEGRNDDGLGGAATYFSLAASNYTPVHLIGVVGEDFPQPHIDMLDKRDIDLEGLERVPGETFRWKGRYHEDINERDTLDTQLNVFEQFSPKLHEAARDAKYLFLANIHPALQLSVMDQAKADFIGLDTMNLWIQTTRDDLLKVLERVDVIIINDSEVRLLTEERNLVKGARAVANLGPRIVVVKKGEHGCILFMDDEIFTVPAYPLEQVADPTGAGDSFAGGFMGYLAAQDNTDFDHLRRAVIYGTVTASFTCEHFGTNRLGEITQDDIESRYKEFQKLACF